MSTAGIQPSRPSAIVTRYQSPTTSFTSSTVPSWMMKSDVPDVPGLLFTEETGDITTAPLSLTASALWLRARLKLHKVNTKSTQANTKDVFLAERDPNWRKPVSRSITRAKRATVSQAHPSEDIEYLRLSIHWARMKRGTLSILSCTEACAISRLLRASSWRGLSLRALS